MSTFTRRDEKGRKVRSENERDLSLIGVLRRKLWAALFENDLDTMEVFLMRGQGLLSIALIALAHGNNSLIAEYPPLWQSIFITLPAWAWSLALMASVICVNRSRAMKNDCKRRNSSFLGLLVMGFLWGPLYLRGPGLSVVVLGATVYQATVAARLLKLCEAQAGEKCS